LEFEPSKRGMIHSRTAAREAALAALYQIFVGKAKPVTAISEILKRELYSAETQLFIKELVNGVMDYKKELDAHIKPLVSAKWDFYRIAIIERTLLRMACYELFYIENIPPKATINEAVTIAKKYGSAESSNFVNGILANLYELSPKVDWDPSKLSKEEEFENPTPLEESEESELEMIQEDSTEFEQLKKSAPWTIAKDEEK
jgi:N utilization substance protein B